MGAAVTIAEISRRLGVTQMAVNLWRQGSKARYPLEFQAERVGKTHRLHVPEPTLLEWLTAYRPDLVDKWHSA